MSFVAAAVVGGSVIGAGIQAGAASSAADKQAAAARDANRLQWDMFQQQRADMDPWRQAGMQALYGTGGLFRRKDGGSGMALREVARPAPSPRRPGLLASLALAGGNEPAPIDSQPSIAADQYEIDPEFTRNFSMADFQADPGYEFRMREGQKALERSAAARGGLQSGGTLKALARYGQDYASNEFSNAYNRFNMDRDRRFNRLSSIAGIGQTAGSQIAAAGQNYANQAGSNLMGAANAAGAAGIASANAWGNTLSSLGRLPMEMTWMDRWAKAKGV